MSDILARTHAVSGLAAGLAVGLFSEDVATAALCAGIGMVASFVPDLDHERAKAVRALGPLGWLLCRIIRATSAAVGLPKHRGLSHCALFAVAVGVAAGATSAVWLSHLSPYLVAGAAAAGVAAALAGDWITKQSLPHLWWPLSRTQGPPKWLRITTGRRVEKLVVFPLVLAGCGWLTYLALTP